VKKTVIGIVAVLALVFTMAPAVQATESRAQSLLYNLAFEDQVDVFLFPQLLPKYPGVYFHLPNSTTNIHGGLILDLDDAALGVFVRRPTAPAFDQFRMLALDATLPGTLAFNPGLAIEPHYPGQIFDIMYGKRSWGVAVRMHMFSDISQQTGLIAGADALPANGSFTADLNIGFNVSKGFDLRTNLSFNTVKDTWVLVIGRVGMRYLDPRIKRTRLIVAGELEFGLLAPEGGDSAFGLGIPFRGGVKMALIPDTMFLGLLGGIDIQVFKEPDVDMRLGLVLPTLEMGLEWHALSWLHLRAAIKGAFGVLLAHPGDNNPQYEQMAFSSGLGIFLGPFTIDGVIRYTLWQNGPDLSSGIPGIFSGVTVSFNWGGAKQAPVATDSDWDQAEETKPEAPAKVEKPAEVKPPPAEEKPAETKPAAEKKEGGFEGWQE
jgi:hypothetical protein